ncbi:uncharacterized protein BO97DRAFT_472823 [Aspergillus homomorphus CBS 101889]|uniref:DJ-1/PfpI domain-containing protein n=1 Tax=Aspergillus homomorphus (strain CBS 101889) TaxID=1450537 RepID=A0A395HN55_ASPHC|nr:hypothetical protein BO97DRAFT_472823 [Aspergillus homomorphus CBS 101889]RAL08919.1 hypothetical protein BO97DRAFT_472823 [Aspergillus homomorphus CBS 101889]
MSSPIDLRNPGRPIHVGVILLNTVTEQFDIVPVNFFSVLSREFLKDMPDDFVTDELKAQALDFVFHWVTETGDTPARLTSNLRVVPTDSFATCPPLDIVVLGASKLGYQANEAEKEFLRKSYKDCAAFLTVCGGFEPALAAGILEGQTATGPRFMLPRLRQESPGTNWVEKRYVCSDSGKLWSTGTLLNGLDMVAAFGRSVWGGEGSLVDNMIKKGYFPERDVDYKEAAVYRQWQQTMILNLCVLDLRRLGRAKNAGHVRFAVFPLNSRPLRMAVGADEDRCIKFGYDCTLFASQSSSSNEQSSTESSSTSDCSIQSRKEDVVSSLFKTAPNHEDQSAQMRDLHRQTLRKALLGDSCSHHEDDGLKTNTPPLSESSAPGTKYNNLNVSMKEADELLSQFKYRTVYFPFVEVPEALSAASMAKSRPFLFFAILVVSAVRRPLLQRKLDEKFRRVLSERIVLHGEKSLDYVQGLLVYLAWYPMHIRPMNNQMWQYLQILTGMISDLKLDHKLQDTAMRNSCLGCYNLSSLISFGLRRRSDTAIFQALKSSIGDETSSNQDISIETQLSRIQILWETLARHRSDSREDTLESGSDTLSFHLHMQDLERRIRSDVPATGEVPLRLSIQSLKVVPANLPWTAHSSSPNRRPPSDPLTVSHQPLEHLQEARSCFSEIQGFFDYLLTIPTAQYIYFSLREWCQIILTISTASQICFVSSPSVDSQWNELQTTARYKMQVYLESLSHRMSTLSISKPGDTPDTFSMFKSVLDIVLETYAAASSNSPSVSPYDGSGTDALSTLSAEKDEPSPTKSSRCPIMNGSIKQTEFWEAVQQSNAMCGSGTGAGYHQAPFGAGMDKLFDDDQDWPSLFSEWVNFT